MTLAALCPGPGVFRLLLAGVVLLSHLSALNIGRPAVVLFFVLSGYWVSLRWLGGSEDPVRFVIGRTLRIWPLFALVSALTWVGLGALDLPHSPDPVTGLLLLGSASRDDMILLVAWSLDLELQFYLCLPLMWLAARRLPARQLWALGLAAWALGAWLMTRGAWNFLLYLPAFAAGMWLARSRWRPTGVAAITGLAAFAAIGGAFALSPDTLPLLFKLGGLSPLAEQLGHLLWSAPLLPVVAHVLRRPSSSRDRALGDVSYPLYLVHSPVITAMIVLTGLSGIALKLAVLPVVALVTAILFLVVDRPLETARRRRAARPDLVATPAFAPLNSGRKHPN